MKIALALKVAGWFLVVAAVISGVYVIVDLKIETGVYFTRLEPHPDRFIYGFGVMIGGIIGAIPLIGFGVVIQTLIGIKDELTAKKLESPLSSLSPLDKIEENYKMKTFE